MKTGGVHRPDTDRLANAALVLLCAWRRGEVVTARVELEGAFIELADALNGSTNDEGCKHD